MMEIKEMWLDHIPNSVDWGNTLFLAIEGTEKDLKRYIQVFSEVSTILDECLQQGRPIVLITSKNVLKPSVLLQYGTFLVAKMKKNLQNTATQTILLLRGRKEGDQHEHRAL